MATNSASPVFEEIDAPAFQEIDDSPAFEEIDDAVVANEAQRASAGAVQAINTMAAPTRLDWSDVNEQLDKDRFYEMESLRAQGLPDKAREVRQGISPHTAVGQMLNRQAMAEQQLRVDTAATAARPGTPATALTALLGPGLASTTMPAIESAAQSLGGATGGAAGAALAAVGTAGTGGMLPLALGVGGAITGSFFGSKAQESLLETTETPEETQARQQRAAQSAEENPVATRIGAAAASLPYFGLSLAQLGRAATGDRGAIRNLALSGTIGAATEAGVAKLMRGEDAKPEDIAAAFFSNMLLNEPTKLARKFGLHPSTEQAAIEAAETKYGGKVPRVGEGVDFQADLTTRGTTSSADVFANVPRVPAEVPGIEINAPEVPSLEALKQEVKTLGDAVTDEASYDIYNTAKQKLRKAEFVERNGALPISLTERDAYLKPLDDLQKGSWKKGKKIGNDADLGDIFEVSGGDMLFRGVTEEDWSRIQKQGFVDTDSRGSISPKEGINLAENTATASGYIPLGKKGIVLAIKPEGLNLFGIKSDDYVRTGGKIPIENIVGVSGPIGRDSQMGEMFIPQTPKTSAAEPSPLPIEPTPPAEPPPAAAPEAAPEGSTSNKEAVVNAERAARELDPVIKEARISNAESIDHAQQVISSNPLKPQEIVTRLRENPQERTISLEDSAVLLVERTRLNKERKDLLARAADENLSAEEQAAAKEAFEGVETRLNELDQAAQDARSTWGRFGQLWQRSMREDFTLEPLLQRARLKKGEPLSAEESAQIETIAAEHEAAQKEADPAVEKAEATAVEKNVDLAIAESAKQPDAEPAVRSLADRIIAKLDSRAEAARKRLRERFKTTATGVDPLILADFVDLAVSTISKTAVKSSQWIASMVKEFGEGVRPYLQTAWNAADKQLDKVVESSTGDKKKRAAAKTKILSAGEQQSRVSMALAERIKEGESLDEQGRYIDRLVDSFVAGGVRDRTALVAAVKSVLEPLSPGITNRKVGELISGYGQSTTLSKDPLKIVKRDLKGQLQQVSKLEALAAREPLKKTGPERRTASDEERRLIKEVNAAKKEAGVTTTDPETQLKSTMDSARTRFSNQIKDLTFEIETGQRPPNRTPVQYEQDIQIMRGLRDRLKQTVRELQGPQEITEEQRIRITTRGLLDSIAALESRIAGEAPKGKRAAPDTPEIRALKAKRDALRQEFNEINSADSLLRENRKAEALVRSIERAEAELSGTTKRADLQQGPESQLVAEAQKQLAAVREQLQAKRDADPAVQQERMDKAEAAVEKAIKKLDEQIQAGDISVQRAPTPARSQRLEDLRMQRDAMNRLRNQLRIEARPRPNPLDVAIKARKSQLARQEADYQARIAAKDFAPRSRKPPLDISSDPAALDALARVQAVKDQFGKLQEKWKLENRTRTEKILGGIKQTWDAMRNLKLSMDLSAPLQTAKAMAAHPIEGAKAIGKGAAVLLQQFFRNSNTYAKRVEQQIVNSPNNTNGLYKQMKLDLSEVTGTKREENAGSILERLADLESRWQDVPEFAKGLIGMNGQQLVRGAKGIAKALPKVVGLSIKASNAGFGAIANHMRARTADSILARSARRRGAPTKVFLELIGNEVNSATGKGGLRGEEGIRALLFAPNYYLSILKQLSFQPVLKAAVKHEGAAAREIMEEYVRAAATVTSIGVLQYLFGNRDKQTLDPRSPDFARAKTDRGTSLDFTMGRGAYVTLATQLATGERINRKGRVEKQDRSQAFLSFLKGRLSREISTGLTTAAGTDFKGKPIDAAGLAKELVAPLSWQDVDDVLKREGLTRGSFIQMLNLLGVTHRLAE